MENNKLKVKDLVNIGIFSALYMVISMIVMIPVGIAPILWLIWPGIAGLFGGAFFTLLMTKVPKQGAALILAIITGLLYFATGECTWVIIVTFAVAGILGGARCTAKGLRRARRQPAAARLPVRPAPKGGGTRTRGLHPPPGAA